MTDDKPFTLDQIADAIIAVAKREAAFTKTRVAVIVYRDDEGVAKVRDDIGKPWPNLEAYLSAKLQEAMKSG